MKNDDSRANHFSYKDESGSTLVMVLMVLGVVGLMAVATMSLSTYLARDKTRTSQLGQVDTFAQRLTALTTDPATCFGVPGALPRPLKGLQFFDGTAYTNIAFSNVGGAKQEVRIQTNSADAGADHFLGAGLPAEGMPNVVVQSLFVQNVIPNGSDAYIADLGFRLKVDGQQYADRKVGQISLHFNAGPLPGSAMIGCDMNQSSEIVCENMGCKFTATAPGSKCSCGFPAMSCVTANPWRDYIVGVNASVDPPTPICRTLKVSCTDKKGPGFVLAGVDETGQPICQPLEGAPAVTCPYAGTSTAGVGNPAAPAGCNCNNAGETWNGAACSLPPSCSIAGTSVGGSGPAAPAAGAGCKCNNLTDTWTGAVCASASTDGCDHLGEACGAYDMTTICQCVSGYDYKPKCIAGVVTLWAMHPFYVGGVPNCR